MASGYSGPLRGEPLAIELHNTLFAAAGAALDGLADQSSVDAWLKALGTRLPAGGARGRVRLDELLATRDTVRKALRATLEEGVPSRDILADLNVRSARASYSVAARWRRTGPPERELDPRPGTREDIVIAALAADAIKLITGPRRTDLHACGAPGCMLLYLKDHPRQEWCSAACGNRARQARHYRRTRTSH